MSALWLSVALAAEPSAVDWSPRAEVPVTVGLGLAWLLSETALKHALVPARCRWCEPNAFDTAARRAFNPNLSPSLSGAGGPDVASTVIGLGVLPVALLALDAWLEHEGGDAWVTRWAADLVIIMEATLSAMVSNQAVKFGVGRARPCTVGEAPSLLADAVGRDDQNVSFFSGHTTFAVGLAVSAGVVATLRGFKYGWVTWAVGVPLALTTAMLRLAADKHWATDVIVGAAVGAAFSVALPLLFHQLKAKSISVGLQPGGASVSGQF